MKCWLIGLVFVAAFAPAEGAEPRRWSDITGKYSVEATFVKVEDGKVFLARTDGRSVAVALEKLSEPDREYVKRQVGEPGLARQQAEEAAPPVADTASKPVWAMDLAKM